VVVCWLLKVDCLFVCVCVCMCGECLVLHLLCPRVPYCHTTVSLLFETFKICSCSDQRECLLYQTLHFSPWHNCLLCLLCDLRVTFSNTDTQDLGVCWRPPSTYRHIYILAVYIICLTVSIVLPYTIKFVLIIHHVSIMASANGA
jgi:hypothetical protein